MAVIDTRLFINSCRVRHSFLSSVSTLQQKEEPFFDAYYHFDANHSFYPRSKCT